MDGVDNETIGRRLRTLRHGRGWTLEKLSATSGVSSSNISKIEKGSVAPAFDTLLRLARSIGVALEDLLKLEETGSYSARRTITKRGEAIHFANGQYDYEVHTSELRSKRMIPLAMRIRTRDVPAPSDWSSHDGEEFVYVVSGSIELHTQHYTPQVLEAEESAYIDSAMPHAFVSIGQGDAHVLSICFAREIPLEVEIAKAAQARQRTPVDARSSDRNDSVTPPSGRQKRSHANLTRAHDRGP